MNLGRKLHLSPVAAKKSLFLLGPRQDSSEWGQALEQFIFQELRAWLSYRHDDRPLAYWRTVDQREVDFVIDEELAIEVKSSTRLHDTDFKGLRAISEESTFKNRIVICREATARQTDDGILILPVEEFLTRLWEIGF